MDRRLVLPFVLAAALTTAAAPPLDTLRADVARHGAKATVAALVATHRWDGVLAAIDAGGDDWIDLAPSLALGTDAATSEGLTIALATALPKNPTAVLRIVEADNGPVLGIARVCGTPFIEDSVDVTAYRARALKALASASDTPSRAACITAIKAHG